ncbi:hypothetical protein EJ03DRAFT_360658 [Teratosphaeria nubilosa]|uniref:Apple domain-containing protein n=1 Tax=Teratosphaeria nubilosa TaxID=161662 RepID=A0A6G1LDR9_9PEZI|nr:hypothetical protein EJ03DRAFT_360658 [Teratosphaeria nubilosa]
MRCIPILAAAASLLSSDMASTFEDVEDISSCMEICDSYPSCQAAAFMDGKCALTSDSRLTNYPGMPEVAILLRGNFVGDAEPTQLRSEPMVESRANQILRRATSSSVNAAAATVAVCPNNNGSYYTDDYGAKYYIQCSFTNTGTNTTSLVPVLDRNNICLFDHQDNNNNNDNDNKLKIADFHTDNYRHLLCHNYCHGSVTITAVSTSFSTAVSTQVSTVVQTFTTSYGITATTTAVSTQPACEHNSEHAGNDLFDKLSGHHYDRLDGSRHHFHNYVRVLCPHYSRLHAIHHVYAACEHSNLHTACFYSSVYSDRHQLVILPINVHDLNYDCVVLPGDIYNGINGAREHDHPNFGLDGDHYYCEQLYNDSHGNPHSGLELRDHDNDTCLTQPASTIYQTITSSYPITFTATQTSISGTTLYSTYTSYTTIITTLPASTATVTSTQPASGEHSRPDLYDFVSDYDQQYYCFVLDCGDYAASFHQYGDKHSACLDGAHNEHSAGQHYDHILYIHYSGRLQLYDLAPGDEHSMIVTLTTTASASTITSVSYSTTTESTTFYSTVPASTETLTTTIPPETTTFEERIYVTQPASTHNFTATTTQNNTVTTSLPAETIVSTYVSTYAVTSVQTTSYPYTTTVVSTFATTDTVTSIQPTTILSVYPTNITITYSVTTTSNNYYTQNVTYSQNVTLPASTATLTETASLTQTLTTQQPASTLELTTTESGPTITTTAAGPTETSIIEETTTASGPTQTLQETTTESGPTVTATEQGSTYISTVDRVVYVTQTVQYNDLSHQQRNYFQQSLISFYTNLRHHILYATFEHRYAIVTIFHLYATVPELHDIHRLKQQLISTHNFQNIHFYATVPKLHDIHRLKQQLNKSLNTTTHISTHNFHILHLYATVPKLHDIHRLRQQLNQFFNTTKHISTHNFHIPKQLYHIQPPNSNRSLLLLTRPTIRGVVGASVYEPTAEDCISACSANPKCQGVGYNTTSGVCDEYYGYEPASGSQSNSVVFAQVQNRAAKGQSGSIFQRVDYVLRIAIQHNSKRSISDLSKSFHIINRNLTTTILNELHSPLLRHRSIPRNDPHHNNIPHKQHQPAGLHHAHLIPTNNHALQPHHTIRNLLNS